MVTVRSISKLPGRAGDAGWRERSHPYVLRNGLAIFRFGSGAPLLLMPYPHAISVIGDPTPAALIAGLVHLGRQVITFDPPGAGQSTRALRLDMPEMLACAQEAVEVCAGGETVDVVGHSQGGLAALAYSLEHPERVHRLVLVCSASGGPAYLRAPGALWNRSHPDFWRMALLGTCYALTRRRAAEQVMLNLIVRDSYVVRTHFHPEPVLLAGWLQPARPRTWWGQVARRLDYSGRLREVDVPTLVVAGRHDPQMPLACAAQLAQGIAGSQHIVFERSGHYPFIEEADWFWKTMAHFLNPPSRTDPYDDHVCTSIRKETCT